ncbi:MAG: hypothetical protein H7336_12495 [Bacteriovorax sp.]|nr:hypothetical protein [Bacteriovorax sp.]
MKVGNSEQAQSFKDNEDLLKRMNKGLNRKITAKENEIKQVDALYDKKIAATNVEGEHDFENNLDRNQQKIIGESNQFEEKLKGYQDRLQKAHDNVTTEESALKNGHQVKIEDMKKQLEENFQDQYFNTQESSREIQASSQDTLKDVSSKSKIEKAKVQGDAKYEINALSTELNSKGANIERDYRKQLDQQVKTHNAEMDEKRDELKKVDMVETGKNKRLNDEKTRVNQEQLIYQDKHQHEMLKQRDADFKVRYENLVKQHDQTIKDLASHLDVDVKKMIDKTATQKKILESRETDPFYHLDQLSPKMMEDLKTVTISMPVVEYEKENVHLSTQGRLIKITLSRKYTDSLNAEDGTLNRSTRSELFSKELPTKDILNPKEITQSYEDGILSFKIKKA